MTQYNPRMVLRQTSNTLLREYFEKKGCPLDVPWDDLGERQIQAVYDEFLNLEESRRQQFETDFHDVHNVAQSTDGIRIIVENAVILGLDIQKELELSDSRYDKAMYVLLHYPEAWNNGVPVVQAESLSRRGWHRRKDLPKHAPDISEPAISSLKTGISAFYWQAEGRGKNCQIEHIQRNKIQDYFFVYLSDHADTQLDFDDSGNLKKTHRRSAFEVVFIFDRARGIMDVYANGGKDVYKPLQEIFARTILGTELGPDDANNPYNVEVLKDKNMMFPTDPEDCIIQVAVRMLRLAPLGNTKKKITVKLPSNGNPEEIYISLENDLNGTNLPVSNVHVERAAITMTLTGYKNKKSLTFEIGPKNCTLKSEADEFRLLGEKYLRKWRIDNAD